MNEQNEVEDRLKYAKNHILMYRGDIMKVLGPKVKTHKQIMEESSRAREAAPKE